jgi:hypothetical protein
VQDAPAAASFWFVQVGVPLLQSKVPGLHMDPQVAPIMHCAQVPLPSQTMPAPHDIPAFALVCTHTCFPVLQEYVPGAHMLFPQEPPAVQLTHMPLPSQT